MRLTTKTREALRLLQRPAPRWQDGFAPGILDNWPTGSGGTDQPLINWATGHALERHGLATILAPFAKGWRSEIELTAKGREFKPQTPWTRAEGADPSERSA